MKRFCEAVTAELPPQGFDVRPGANVLMHLHPVYNEADIYGHGRPTRIAHTDRDLRQPAGARKLPERCYSIPWFKHHRPDVIAQYALAFRKAAEHADELD